ncbi:MAG: glycosyl hydrolase [Calditrichaeota bacterium]|nr:MAG: glycosyl hydrolase [Calditrichota bacterium]
MKEKSVLYLVSAILALFSLFAGRCTKEKPIDLSQKSWIGNAICYSGYRQGQNPQTQTYPTQEQISEDLKILERHWRLIRTYGSDQHSQDILHVIRREKINLKVMLGAWLDGEPDHEAENAGQIQTCIRLANEFPDIVVAVNVGNEILASWSNHQVPLDRTIEYVKQVQKATRVPVTVADDFVFWRERGAELANVVDFVAIHTYPIWGGQDIDGALEVTIEHLNSVRDALPGKTIVITEAGWASYTVGEAHAPRAGDEKKQVRYFNEITSWARDNNVNVFYFEAFDEPWKGTGTEGHWGLFTVDRKAKLAMQPWYPELMPDGPTSPGYDEQQ